MTKQPNNPPVGVCPQCRGYCFACQDNQGFCVCAACSTLWAVASVQAISPGKPVSPPPGQGQFVAVGTCPNCGSTVLQRKGRTQGKPKYQCSGCRSTFARSLSFKQPGK